MTDEERHLPDQRNTGSTSTRNAELREGRQAGRRGDSREEGRARDKKTGGRATGRKAERERHIDRRKDRQGGRHAVSQSGRRVHRNDLGGGGGGVAGHRAVISPVCLCVCCSHVVRLCCVEGLPGVFGSCVFEGAFHLNYNSITLVLPLECEHQYIFIL